MLHIGPLFSTPLKPPSPLHDSTSTSHCTQGWFPHQTELLEGGGVCSSSGLQHLTQCLTYNKSLVNGCLKDKDKFILHLLQPPSLPNGLCLYLHKQYQWSAIHKVDLLPASSLTELLIFSSEPFLPQSPPLTTLVRRSSFNEKFKLPPFIGKQCLFLLILFKNKVKLFCVKLLTQTISCLLTGTENRCKSRVSEVFMIK